MLRSLLPVLIAVSLFGQQGSKSTSPPPSKADLKRQKKVEEKLAKDTEKYARQAAAEAADHFIARLDGVAVGCLAAADVAFHRDIVRGWGGLLGGGSHAVLGIRSSVAGTIKSACEAESATLIEARFYDASGVLIGDAAMQMIVPKGSSRSFDLPWACLNGSNYLGSNGTIWIPNCAASTARYRISYE